MATPTDRGDEPLPIRTARRLEPARVLDRSRESAHLRTTDVDILMAFRAALDAYLRPLEEALERGGFDPDPNITEGWRRRAKVRPATVRIEFLCELDDPPVTARAPFQASRD